MSGTASGPEGIMMMKISTLILGRDLDNKKAIQ